MTRGFFGIVVYHPKHETNIGTLWRSAWLYEAAFVGTIGRRYQKQATDTPGTANHVPLVHYRDLDDLIEHLPFSCPLVGVELAEGAASLPNFLHPLRAVYLLGAEDHGLPSRVIERCHRLVQIPSSRECSMNVSAAGSIVMYDRYTSGRIAQVQVERPSEKGKVIGSTPVPTTATV